MKKKQFYILAGLIGMLFIISLVSFVVNQWYFVKGKEKAKNTNIDDTTYQAVFLDNNQIYFGHLKNIDSQYPELTNVYYVQLTENAAANSKGNQKSIPTGRLVKLGEVEAHGPKDTMIINKDHILFWENLRPDSQIVQAIRSRN